MSIKRNLLKSNKITIFQASATTNTIKGAQTQLKITLIEKLNVKVAHQNLYTGAVYDTYKRQCC